MQNKDLHDFRIGLNKDDKPEDLTPGEYTDALNFRTGSSKDQQGVGIAETLQSEIEILIGVSVSLYYGDPIGGQFIYSGFEEVQIGTQTWMKKNWDGQYPGSKVYDDDEDNASIYGRLYTHNQAMAADFCPVGWRVPTEADLDALLAELGGAMLAGGKMKHTGTEYWTEPNIGATNSSGFKALPGGAFDLLFDLLGENGMFWIQDESAPVAPVALSASDITEEAFLASWEEPEGADGYYLDVATDVAFAAILPAYNNLDVKKVTSYPISGLNDNTPYYYRVRAYNEVGSSDNSNTTTLTTKIIYDDWFLPSSNELLAMYTELIAYGLGNFKTALGDTRLYWSSTTDAGAGGEYARILAIDAGAINIINKSLATINIRPCRAFNSVAPSYALRDLGPAGGFIFYKSGDDYLEAAPEDVSASEWSNIHDADVIGTDPAIGTGLANTNLIIAQPGHINSAAKLCLDLSIAV